jgi:hypothetical protein
MEDRKDEDRQKRFERWLLMASIIASAADVVACIIVIALHFV